MRLILVSVVLLAMFLALPRADATYLSINSSIDMNDTTIVSWTGSYENANFGANPNSSYFGVGNNTAGATYAVILLKANLSLLPSGAIISGANISLFHSYSCGGSTGNVRNITVNRMLVGWAEGTGTGAFGSAGDASWDKNTSTTTWPGGDFSTSCFSTELGRTSVTCGTKGRYTWAISNQSIQNFLNGTWPYYGFVLRLEKETTGQDSYGFIFKENATAFYTPRIEIVYTTPPAIPNITLTIGSTPAILYTDTDVNFSVYYSETAGRSANITMNATVNGINITNAPVTYNGVASGSTLYFYVGSGNYSKHNNVTLGANLTTSVGETNGSSLTKEIQDSPPAAPAITFYPASAIIGDNINATGNSSDVDGDYLAYWFMWGWNNGTNFTGYATRGNVTVNASHENVTFRVWVMAYDGEVNGTASHGDMNITRILITWPSAGGIYYGKDFHFSFNFTANTIQPCAEMIDSTTYGLGNISSSQNNSRTVGYGSHVYTASCTSGADASLAYSRNTTFNTFYASWNISIYTENEWDTPLNITSANLSIIIKCYGGSSYVYNFTGTIITGVKPLCDVETVSAKIDYLTDSYLRERVPPCSGICEVRMYMADALIYTILQIPIYMSDYNYYSGLVELYKTSSGNHYTIAQGYFDVEHKYVTYLMKDNTYLIRITKNGAIRDIGYLYAATATAQYLSLSQIVLKPSISLISDNILMTAAFLTPAAPTSNLRISYEDLMNLTEDVRIQVFQASNNTAFFDNTYTGSSNFSISLNDINTSFRYSVHFIVNHVILGNSPIPFTVGVGSFGRNFDLGLNPAYAWLYNAFAFFMILLTSWIILPENRLPGFVVLMAETGILSIVQWIAFQNSQMMLFVVFLVAGMVFEIRHRGVT